MASGIGRRQFISAVGGGAVSWPFAAHAQQPRKVPAVPVVGFLAGIHTTNRSMEAFRQSLSEAGFVEGQGVALAYRSADNPYEDLPALAAELARQQVDVILATGGSQSPLAAKAATSTIPIVFVFGGDPVRLGLVASLNRPGGNVTSVTFLTNSLSAKRIGLLRDLSAKAETVGFLVNPRNLNTDLDKEDVQAAADSLRIKLVVVEAMTESDLGPAFTSLAQQHVDVLLVGGDAFLSSVGVQIVALAQHHAMPTIYDRRAYAEAGGLISYGASSIDAFRQGAIYVGRILKGAKPADLPVMQSTKFELVINLKTAKTLGLDVPPTLLSIADEVIG
jgi:putative tryptophan/tyrosine transport system substrate-binding protein